MTPPCGQNGNYSIACQYIFVSFISYFALVSCLGSFTALSFVCILPKKTCELRNIFKWVQNHNWIVNIYNVETFSTWTRERFFLFLPVVYLQCFERFAWAMFYLKRKVIFFLWWRVCFCSAFHMRFRTNLMKTMIKIHDLVPLSFNLAIVENAKEL